MICVGHDEPCPTEPFSYMREFPTCLILRKIGDNHEVVGISMEMTRGSSTTFIILALRQHKKAENILLSVGASLKVINVDQHEVHVTIRMDLRRIFILNVLEYMRLTTLQYASFSRGL
jgi:hypothetical protein